MCEKFRRRRPQPIDKHVAVDSNVTLLDGEKLSNRLSISTHARMGFKKLVRSGMRFSAFTTASHNAARGRDSRARVTRTSGRSLVHLLAACLAVFAVQHAAEAQILPAGPISGTIVWNDTANWAGGVITNTTTGTYSGNAAFQFSAPYTVTSGSIYLSSVTNQTIRVNSFASSTGTQTYGATAAVGPRILSSA